jgi:hypothetical protein
MGSKACTANYVKALAAAHAVLQADINQLMGKAPSRIRDRITAVTAPAANRSDETE